MNRYVKKPIAIEAVKWKGFNNDEIKDFAVLSNGQIFSNPKYLESAQKKIRVLAKKNVS